MEAQQIQDIPTLSNEEVQLNASKSPRRDKIPNRVLKTAIVNIIDPFRTIYNINYV